MKHALVLDVLAVLQPRNDLPLDVFGVQVAVAHKDVVVLGVQIRDEEEAAETGVRVEPDANGLLVVEAEDDPDQDQDDDNDGGQEVLDEESGRAGAELGQPDGQDGTGHAVAVDRDVVSVLSGTKQRFIYFYILPFFSHFFTILTD